MTNHANTTSRGHSYSAVPDETPSALLIWDAPNIDMGLGSILGGRPSSAYRPRFDSLGQWLINEADQLSASRDEQIEPEATVFTNIMPGSADSIRPWIDALRNLGFAVFAKPKLFDDTDVDPDMLAHINRRYDEGVLRSVYVASADGRNFQPRLDELAAEGIDVAVLGFYEHATWAVMSEAIRFVDLEDIPDIFTTPLPRVNLDRLPDDGAWLQPYRSLRSVKSSHHDS
ncbi:NYN domain-containing protein [Corynebacterium parakroppenstedtii]|uniref:NYN domain-containing protein n=1 Tax=Corynebacterium parakroppenstedtii TaxID=2828363 RepID=UPI001C8FA06B|nr:NYN domain-containing protein [Corynebacterium parakroppenstedtii]MBY0795175.1 NYN domain-containing protein [Corynebacterium parakroppenstedtii]